MVILKVLKIEDPYEVAWEKFKEGPWQFFDGVKDQVPNKIVWGDLAITKVMASGLFQELMDSILKNYKEENIESILSQIPVNHELGISREKTKIYESVDFLFKKFRVTKFSISRMSKVLVRKRPLLIPMLDNVILDFLDKTAKIWVSNKNEVPPWFYPLWLKWTEEISPYLKMIREDLILNFKELVEIRKRLSKDKITGVPKNAPILRIWESILYWDIFVLNKKKALKFNPT